MAIGGYSKRGPEGTTGKFASRLEYERAILDARERYAADGVPSREIIHRVVAKCGGTPTTVRSVIRRYLQGR